MSAKNISLSIALLLILLLQSAPAISDEAEEELLARGKYLVEIGGCNDCHTAGFAPSGAKTPESEWLLGDTLGYRGPWGTTYPLNLRTYMTLLTEDQWVTVAKVVQTRPPMPYWALNAMTRDDLIALYRYIRSLGPVETEIPQYVPPGQEPKTPYIQWPAPPE